MIRWALAKYEKTLGPDHIAMLDAAQCLGIVLRARGKLDEAEQMIRWALSGYEKVLGPD